MDKTVIVGDIGISPLVPVHPRMSTLGGGMDTAWGGSIVDHRTNLSAAVPSKKHGSQMMLSKRVRLPKADELLQP